MPPCTTLVMPSVLLMLRSAVGVIAVLLSVAELLPAGSFTPTGVEWDQAVAYWRTLPSDAGAQYDKEIIINAGSSSDSVIVRNAVSPIVRAFGNGGNDNFTRGDGMLSASSGAQFDGGPGVGRGGLHCACRRGVLRREAGRVRRRSTGSSHMTRIRLAAAADLALLCAAPASGQWRNAPEAVATHLDLDMAARLDLLSEAEAMAANGLKVLCLAEAHAVDDPSTPFLNGRLGYAPLALLGFQDPPRAEAADAVAQCQSAGIVPIMITGDHAETARAIAGQLGMLGRDLDAPDLVITGPQMAQLSRADLIHRLGSARVFARVDPEQKIDIVRALRKRGAIMAMTGDGVNDAPAISAADIGIAMGKGGSDVAKEASAIVLADDNFATIVKAIREGRRISDNIARFVSYILTCNVSEVLVLALALLAGLPLPLTPLQILWINLVTDGIPGLALASERAEANVMRRPPDRPHAPIVTRALMLRVAWMSSVMAVLVLAVQVWEMQEPGAPWQSMVFTALVAVQLAYALSLRSNERPVWETGILSNPLLLGALVVTLGLQLLIIYLPVLNAVFETAPLSWGHLGLALGCGLVVLIAAEAAKFARRHKVVHR